METVVTVKYTVATFPDRFKSNCWQDVNTFSTLNTNIAFFDNYWIIQKVSIVELKASVKTLYMKTTLITDNFHTHLTIS